MLSVEQIRSRKAALEPNKPEEADESKNRSEKAYRLANYQKERAEANADSEMNRIINLPIVKPIEDYELEALNMYTVQPQFLNKSVEDGGFRLFRVQAEALNSYIEFNGGFMPITVGGGKTLTSLLIANEAFKRGHSKVMLIIPPNLVDQLRDVDVPFYRSKCLLNIPIHFIPGLPAKKRMAKAMSGCRGLYIYTFSLLSSPQGAEILDAICPSTVIIDEAHNLSGTRNSARAKRFNEFLDTNKPDLISLSGTMTRTTPMDYYSLARHGLKEYNFLPNIKTMAQLWSDAIGSGASSMDESESASVAMSKPLFRLINWARVKFPDEVFEISLSGFRKAFRYRLTTNPGVTSSGEDHLDVGIKIINDPHKSPESVSGWDLMQDLIQSVKDEMITPSGDELEHAMHVWKWLYEIEGAGFYNELYWPSMEWIEKYKGVKGAEAEDLLERSKEYHEAHQEYARELRNFLTYNSEKGLDTPMLVGKNMSQHGAKYVGDALYMAWTDMKGKDFEERLERLKRAIRVCPFKINQTVEWYKTLPKGKGAIIWFYSTEVGKWLKEAFEEAGLDPVYCPAGPAYNSVAIDHDHKDKPLIASISAHGTGKNLQHFEYERYVQWPRDAKLAEQSIGRVHRNGQQADEVYIYTDFAGEFDRGMFSATLNDSIYIHQTLGNRQRLVYATYDPIPQILPYEVLKAWGALGSNSKTDKECQKLLKDKFGQNKS